MLLLDCSLAFAFTFQFSGPDCTWFDAPDSGDLSLQPVWIQNLDSKSWNLVDAKFLEFPNKFSEVIDSFETINWWAIRHVSPRWLCCYGIFSCLSQMCIEFYIERSTPKDLHQTAVVIVSYSTNIFSLARELHRYANLLNLHCRCHWIIRVWMHSSLEVRDHSIRLHSIRLHSIRLHLDPKDDLLSAIRIQSVNSSRIYTLDQHLQWIQSNAKPEVWVGACVRLCRRCCVWDISHTVWFKTRNKLLLSQVRRVASEAARLLGL